MALAPTIQLTWEFAKRDLTDRYAGNSLGLLWILIQPLATIAIYLSVFTLVFKVRIPDAANVEGGYPLYFLSGFVCWMALSDVLARAPTLVSTNAALVRQIVFPTQVLPIKSALAVILTQLVFLALVSAYGVLTIGPSPILAALMIACPLLFFFCAGMASLLSALGVFVRDVKDFVSLLLTGGLFLTPVFYPPGAVEEPIASVIRYNPLSYPIYVFQDILFFQRVEHPMAWAIFATLSITLFIMGQLVFRSLKHLFGDAL